MKEIGHDAWWPPYPTYTDGKKRRKNHNWGFHAHWERHRSKMEFLYQRARISLTSKWTIWPEIITTCRWWWFSGSYHPVAVSIQLKARTSGDKELLNLKLTKGWITRRSEREAEEMIWVYNNLHRRLVVVLWASKHRVKICTTNSLWFSSRFQLVSTMFIKMKKSQEAESLTWADVSNFLWLTTASSDLECSWTAESIISSFMSVSLPIYPTVWWQMLVSFF